MSAEEILDAALHLPAEQRRDLAARLPESVADELVPIPAWHIEEIDRAIAEADANPDDFVSLEEFKRQMDARFGK
jgi:hypothetical protein